jgi:AraC family transcriptional regulator, arabinose operon regulatory protein
LRAGRASGRIGGMKPAPPQKRPHERGTSELRLFGDVVHFYWPFDEQSRWARHPPFNDVCVFSCGWYAEARGHYWERQGLNEAVYIYCTAGRGFFRHGGREWPVAGGDLLYGPPMTQYSYGADPDDPWTIFWLHLAGPGIGLYRALFDVSPEQPVRHVGIRPRAIAAFQTLHHFCRPPLTEARMLALSHSARLALSCLALESGEAARESQAFGVERVREHMDLHADEAADPAAWLKLFRGSRAHFYRQFKQVTGEAPHDYFLRLKIRKATALLEATDLRVADIASMVGLDDPGYFSRLFKRVTGHPPLACRRHRGQGAGVRKTSDR